MLTMLLGRDWTANREEILRMIACDVQRREGGRILLVPELISHDTERRLAAAAGDTASRFAQVLSFSRLARRICDMAGFGAQECMDDGGRIVAMASAARSLHSKLKAYAAVETKPEFLSELVDVVDECKRCCISPEDLKAAAAQTEGSLAQKLEELSLLLTSYDALCSRGKRDPRDQMNWVLEQLEEMDFAREHVLYVDGFPDFTRQHLAVLEHFILHSPHVAIALNCDRVDSTDPAFEKAGNTAHQILQMAQRAGVPVEICPVTERKDALQPMRDLLFQGKIREDAPLNGIVHAFRASSIHQQCRAAAERILDLVHAGARYRDIAIVCSDMPTFASALRLTMRKCGIPIYLSGTEDVSQTGVMNTVLSALDAAMDDLEQRSVLRYLRSVLSPLSQDQCDQIENYAIIWGIDRSKWLTEWTGHPQGLSGIWNSHFEKQLSDLNALRVSAIGPLHRLREHFRASVNLSQQVQSLYAFMEEVGFAQRLEELALEMDTAGDHRSAQILNQLWEILLCALEQLEDTLGETAWDDDTFARLFRLLLSQYDVGTIPTVLDAVTIGQVNAMRCQQQKHLIVLGADEGKLPGYGGSTGVLTDQDRMQLRSMGVPLTGGSMDGLQAEFAEIYGVFCGAMETVTVYSSDSQPSFLFRRLAALSGGQQQADEALADALCDPDAAAAYLAKWQAREAALFLQLHDGYQRTLQRKNFALGSVSADHVQSLYGQRLALSASQIDRQAQCRLAYFLQYGLRAQERKEATVDPAEFGTYVHAVLELTVRDVMALGGFHRVDLQQTLDIARNHSKEYADQRFSQLDSQRMEYLFRRNMLELELVVQELWQELSQADYAPSHMELGFGMDGGMPAIEIPGGQIPACLRGLVDRVDTWEVGESTFFRVVDYKTGKKDFDYCDVANGVGLQMLLYLFALEDSGGDVLSGKRVPAGVQYFPARVPYVSADGALTQEEAAKERKKLWERKGLLLANEDSLKAMDPSADFEKLCCKRKRDGSISGDLADGVQLGQLKDYVMALLRDMVDHIAQGDVQANPYTRGYSFSACTFCPYGSICHPDTVEGRRDFKKMEPQQFWEQIGKEEAHG